MGVAGYARLDARAEISGMGDPSLSRAIIRYREVQTVDGGLAGADDVGVALVLDGEYPAAAEAIDLGSGRIRHLDLATEVVVLDWVYPSTLDYVCRLIGSAAGLDDAILEGEFGRALRQYCHDILLGVLGRIGFDPFTRPAYVRLGFRDIIRDLDPNERPVVRISLGRDDQLDIEIDIDDNALLITRRGRVHGGELKQALGAAFPSGHVDLESVAGRERFRVAFPLPASFASLRRQMDEIRSGILELCSRFEPDRHHATSHALGVFGPRDTLVLLERPAALPAPASVLVGTPRAPAGVA